MMYDEWVYSVVLIVLFLGFNVECVLKVYNLLADNLCINFEQLTVVKLKLR